MRTAGVDLAAEPRGTALALIEWAPKAARLVELHLGVGDAVIVEAAGRVDKVGIDCAFGWPDAFVEFVSAHAAGGITGGDVGAAGGGGAGGTDGAGGTNGAGKTGAAPGDGATVDGGMAWRRTLAYRETDRRAREITGRWPLSVSTDRLGLTAMRCAGLLARLGVAGLDVDRSGSGRVAEVYPGASLRLWGFDTRGYRTDAEARRQLLARISAAAPWLEIGRADRELMVTSGDAFDAVVAALAGRSAAVGLCEPPASGVLDQARREGWIALPTGTLGELV